MLTPLIVFCTLICIGCVVMTRWFMMKMREQGEKYGDKIITAARLLHVDLNRIDTTKSYDCFSANHNNCHEDGCTCECHKVPTKRR